MISEKRSKIVDERERKFLENVIAELDKACELEKQGQHKTVEQMRLELLEMLKNQYKSDREEPRRDRTPVDRSKLPAAGEILISSDELRLKAFDETCKDMYLKVVEQTATFKKPFEDGDYTRILWNSANNELALYYAIEDLITNKYVGYIGVKDTGAKVWELALELDEPFRYKGIGKEALLLLLEGLNAATGEKMFRARIDSDNYACQALMKKVGARPNGISEYILHGEELEQFQQDNANLIDDRMRAIADEFCVDAEDLVGQVLEYLIDWPVAGRCSHLENA